MNWASLSEPHMNESNVRGTISEYCYVVLLSRTGAHNQKEERGGGKSATRLRTKLNIQKFPMLELSNALLKIKAHAAQLPVSCENGDPLLWGPRVPISI